MIVVFDAFGTLVKASNRTNPYGRLNRKCDSNMHRDFMTQNKTLQQFCEQVGQQGMYPNLAHLLQQELENIELFADVVPTLEALRGRGIKVGLCSNLAHGYGARVRQLLPDMSAYIMSYEVGCRKPEPQIYENVCSALSCKAKDVLFVGDSEKADVIGPKEFGMRSFHLQRDAGIDLNALLRKI